MKTTFKEGFVGKPIIANYADFQSIACGQNREDMVEVSAYDDSIASMCWEDDMLPITGQKIYVRKAVAKMLAHANVALKNTMEGHRLEVAYGYRHPNIQKKYFDKRYAEIAQSNPGVSHEELIIKTHQFIASPDVAGHPTGGAVDITIIDEKNIEIDMGTEIADFSDEERIQTFVSSITSQQMKNRLMLHDIMVSVGFAPFHGEWWHFSYGDREWAFLNDEASSIYDQIDFIVLSDR